MKAMKRVLCGALAVLLLCGTVSVHAAPSGEQDFALLLAQDRLALREADFEIHIPAGVITQEYERYRAAMAALGLEAPAEPEADILTDGAVIDAAQLYRSARYISFSPDGRRLFVVLGDLPVFYDFDTRDLRIIVPVEGISAAFYTDYAARTLTQPEDQGVLWSPDGRHIAFTSPRQVLMMMRLAVNILLVDTRAGTVDKVFQALPDHVKLTDGYTNGYPFRVGFSPDGSTLYYELLYVSTLGLRRNEIRAYQLETGQTEVVSFFTSESTTMDAALWPVAGGLLESIAHMRASGERGLAIRGLGQADRLIVRNPSDPLEAGMSHRVAGVVGGRGLLYTSWGGTMMRPLFQLFSLDSLSPDIFRRALAVRLQAEPAQRLVDLDLSLLNADGQGGFDADALAGLDLPANAALSPDGQYMLLLIGGPEHEQPRLYMYDFSAQVLGAVDLSRLDRQGDDFMGFFEGTMSTASRGLRWLADNRLLITIGGQHRLYEWGSKDSAGL